MNTLQLQRLGPQLVSAHPHLLWKQAVAERRFKRQHFYALESERWNFAELSIKWTSKVLNISKLALLGRRRFRHSVDCRHVAMTVAYELSGLSSIALGRLFNRGHEMILWAQKRVNNDKTLRAQADKVVKAVKKELRKK